MQNNIQTSENATPDTPTLFLEDFHAKILALQESSKASHHTHAAGCGWSFTELFAKLDRDTSLWKTSQTSLTTEWDECLQTFPRAGIMQNGKCYRVSNSDYRTRERDYSLLPTPTKTDEKRGRYLDINKLKRYSLKHQMSTSYYCLLKGFTNSQIVSLYDLMMGFPILHTELER